MKIEARFYERHSKRWICTAAFRSYHDAVRYVGLIKNDPMRAQFDSKAIPFYYVRNSDAPHPSNLWPAASAGPYVNGMLVD